MVLNNEIHNNYNYFINELLRARDSFLINTLRVLYIPLTDAPMVNSINIYLLDSFLLT